MIVLTDKQKEAAAVVKNNRRVLLVGGARSGKTFFAVSKCVAVGLLHPNARILICRQYAVDVRGSVWKITLPKVLQEYDLHIGSDYQHNIQDMEIRFPNGSVIICAGLDDAKRREKILGQEYTIIYMNESQDIDYQTVKLFRSRLSQSIGYPTKLICDLNPTSINHWTYKLWYLGVDPETKQPLKDPLPYGVCQMNPYDNKVNLPDDYIQAELETLTGNARNRFLLGEYSTDSDLRIFSPRSRYQWQQFVEWVGARWADVRLVGGLDLGWNDADGFAIVAYIPNERDHWVVYEHKARRQGIEQLANAIKAGILFCRQSIPTSNPDFQIFCDTATVRHGHEGDSKKSASQLSEVYGLPIAGAYKREKLLSIELLQSEINDGHCHIPIGGAIEEECELTIWTKLEDGTIERRIDDDVYHPDILDALRYCYNWLSSYGNPIMRSPQFSFHSRQEFSQDFNLQKLLNKGSRDVW